jgi:hypothetical protein
LSFRYLLDSVNENGNLDFEPDCWDNSYDEVETGITEVAETGITEVAETGITEVAETGIIEVAETGITEAVQTSVTETVQTSVTETVQTSVTETVQTSQPAGPSVNNPEETSGYEKGEIPEPKSHRVFAWSLKKNPFGYCHLTEEELSHIYGKGSPLLKKGPVFPSHSPKS